KEKPGTCPRDVDETDCRLVKFAPECESDSNCNGTMKCCYSGCRKRCLLPLEDKKDSCPYFNSSVCRGVLPLRDQCFTDDQCPGSDRCCCFNCRHMCLPTELVKPGQCPAVERCPVHLPNTKCQKDSECAGKKKCCKSCGNKCVDPETVRSGYCPLNND
ncbi:hypothetical protein FKM82_021953, partial [Ascaphus truei]